MNKKILITSQPGVENDDLDKENKGKIYEWGWMCPCCKNLQQYHWSKEKPDGTWAGIVWEKIYDDEAKTLLNIEKTANTAALQCYSCTNKLIDNESNRRYLNETGQYILINDYGNDTVVTYSWCAFVNQKISFKI